MGITNERSIGRRSCCSWYDFSDEVLRRAVPMLGQICITFNIFIDDTIRVGPFQDQVPFNDILDQFFHVLSQVVQPIGSFLVHNLTSSAPSSHAENVIIESTCVR